MIEVKNLAKVNNDIDRWLDLVEGHVRAKAKALTIKSLSWLSMQSPQYSGDFAASWKVGINEVDTSFSPYVLTGSKKDTPTYKQGDSPAYMYAMNANKAKFEAIKFGDKVWISNSAHHWVEIDKTSKVGNRFYASVNDKYAPKVEADTLKLRDVQRDKGRVIARYVETLLTSGVATE